MISDLIQVFEASPFCNKKVTKFDSVYYFPTGTAIALELP